MTQIKHYATKAYEEGAIARNHEKINAITLKVYEPLWMENFYGNLPHIRKGLDTTQLKRPTTKKAIIIGGGQSIAEEQQLEALVEAGIKGQDDLFTIIACDKVLRACVDAGITPDYVTGLDGEPGTRNFFQGIRRADLKGCKAVVSIIYHPRTIDLVEKKMPMYWYMPMWDPPLSEGPSVTRIIHWLTAPLDSKEIRRKRAFPTFGNVGGFSWYFSHFLGHETTYLMGLDYGYPADTNIEDTQYYSGYQRHIKMENEVIERNYRAALEGNPETERPEGMRIEDCYRLLKNPETGREALVGLNWDSYRFSFLSAAAMNPNKTVNLSPISSLFGPGIEFQDFDVFLEEATK